MSQPVIKAESLWKEYAVGALQSQHHTFYEKLTYALKSPFSRIRNLQTHNNITEKFWALQDVNFEVQPGEVVGILGRNGAGKSTLLKILSRITAPTRGRIVVRGRLTSLLEVGTGFHPELSGRENIFLNATILGMTKREIERKFDEIVAFSGVEKFIDTPVKRYSSGMYVRLAFSVAAHVDADILLVDEVLAVGDAEFQKRCLGVMGDVARGGRTVLFVSHNLTALRNLCHSGLLLENGRPTAMGDINGVLNSYSASRASGNDMIAELNNINYDDPASILRVQIEPQTKNDTNQLSVNTPFLIRCTIEVRIPEADIGVFLHCHDENQARLFSSGSFFNPQLNGIKLGVGRHEFECEIPGNLLNEGEYTLDVLLVRDRHIRLAQELSLLSFRIHDEPMDIEGWNWPIIGVIRPKLNWSHSVSEECIKDNMATISSSGIK
ncbi:MAG: ABC transporter ATP-binding protein [Gammaproteobacteria bacterium]|nr:ABC transporter ATP-binding protein [Gammaproteobacteria bacterium]